MDTKPNIGDLLGKGIWAHDIVINLMRFLRDREILPVEEGIGIMRSAIQRAEPTERGVRDLQAEIDAWEAWSPDDP